MFSIKINLFLFNFGLFLIKTGLFLIKFKSFLIFFQMSRIIQNLVLLSQKWTNYIKNDLFCLFLIKSTRLQTFLIVIDLFLINFKQFDLIRTRFNWFFCHNYLDSDDKFGSKNSIKWQFESDVSPNFTPSWFNCQSLLHTCQ